MNKNVSLAIEKAVGNLNKIGKNSLKELKDKKPDLFSLNHETELFQNEKVYSGVTVAQIVVLYFFENIKCALKIVPFSRKNSKMSKNVQKKLYKNRSEFFGLRRPNGEQK